MELYPNIFFDLLVYFITGLIIAYYYYHFRRKDLLGGFWGGVAIGTLGAVLISVLTSFDSWFIRSVTWLMQPKIGDRFLFRVNLITAVFGAILFIYILNRINHNKDRR
jgi:hypothetical protein